MNLPQYENTLEFARKMDREDELASFRSRFLIPKAENGQDSIYLCGNSLGLQPRKVREYIGQELDDWAKFGVEGHFHAKNPWLPYHEMLTDSTARLMGAKPGEVVVMNSLTVNLHLMMVSFYRPTKTRFKILCEGGAFPSDQYAIATQIRGHGFDPATAMIEMKPRAGEATIRLDDILETIEREGESIALVLFGNVNYLTGQYFDMEAITRAGHAKGCNVGFDLAHGAGNLHVKLHDWNVDFAVWCSYKYLNAGPGGIAGCFVHERHTQNKTLPRFGGWWGHDKKTRFQMGPNFDPIPTAEGWQLSNPPIFQLAALRASMEIFDEAGMARIRAKGDRLTGYVEYLLESVPNHPFTIITPRDPKQRGCQLSLRVKSGAKDLLQKLIAIGVICDFREPDIIRVAPAPLYNSFEDVFRFGQVCQQLGGK